MSRADRVAELIERIDRYSETADALEALITRIEEIPVGRMAWQKTWELVLDRLRRDATGARQAAVRAEERRETLTAAEEARERWIPKRTQT